MVIIAERHAGVRRKPLGDPKRSQRSVKGRKHLLHLEQRKPTADALHHAALRGKEG